MGGPRIPLKRSRWRTVYTTSLPRATAETPGRYLSIYLGTTLP